MSASPTKKRSRRSTIAAASKALFRRWNPATRWPTRETRADAAEGQVLLVNLSGRGDKDMHTVAERSGIQF
jgi:Tryptophan synthase beta chain